MSEPVTMIGCDMRLSEADMALSPPEFAKRFLAPCLTAMLAGIKSHPELDFTVCQTRFEGDILNIEFVDMAAHINAGLAR
jgi:hypothetical protein